MCELNAFLRRADGSEELVLEAVEFLRPQQDGVLLRNIFGQESLFKGRLLEVQFRKGKVLLGPLEAD
jgi:predicted RNA-binding protein